MCGICGIAHPESDRPPDRRLLEAMTESLAHRGPDDSGTVMLPHVGLGHRRLSVVGVATGHQPMMLPEGDLTLTYNGEIYNFPALRSELERAGAVFCTAADTEVLLHGYVHWGMEGLLARIAGMFAFALWDGRRRCLYLVRDRLGVKPLYWAATGDGSLYFASELRALRLPPDLPETLDGEAALGFLTWGYLCGGASMLKGIRQLPPGAYLAWEPGRAPEITTYWDLPALWTARQAEPRLSDAAYEESFGALLEQCVRERLLSEVPLGAFLSGGLDSSLICAEILKHTAPLKTFSMGFEERGYSELPWAALVAGELGTEHAEAIADCGDPDLLVQIAAHLDEPFADTSILPSYALCRAARQHLTVALSGDGGDELLAGYTTHAADRLHGWLGHLPGPALGLANHLAQKLPDSRAKVGAVFKLKQFLAGARRNPCDAHAGWRMLFAPEVLRDVVSPDAWLDGFDPFAPFRAAHDEVPELGPLDRMLYVDYKTWLAGDILVKVDRASMAHGLEVRSPFLDHRLVEFCAGLPPHLKLKGFRGKHLMRRTAKGKLPTAVIRRNKAGFNSPVSHGFAGPWRDLARDTLLGPGAPALLRPEALRGLLGEHEAGKRDHGHRLFSLLMYALWHEHHDGD